MDCMQMCIRVVHMYTHVFAGHNLTGIASQFAMHLDFICDVISVTHRSD